MGQEKKVRILSPVDRVVETEFLIEAGATELYGGMFPDWFSKYPYFLSPNQRTFQEAQMNEADFNKVVKICEKHNTPLYLTINNLYFTQEQLPLIIKMAKEAEAMGVKGFIMGSLPLILNVLEAGIKVPIHISTMAVTLNHHSVSFFSDFGIKRFTLPRSLLINEIKEIISYNDEFLYDAFILVGKCPNVEGFCSFLHTNLQKIWPCEQYYNLTIESKNDTPAANRLMNVQKGWQGFPRGHGCGICAIPELIKAGVTGLKLVGRGSPLSFKVSNIKMLLEAIEIHKQYKDDIRSAVIKLKQLYKERFGHPCSPYSCYFPECGF